MGLFLIESAYANPHLNSTKDGEKHWAHSDFDIDECNTCYCHDDGPKWCTKRDCSLYTCKGHFPKEGVQIPVAEGEKFIPLDSECNRCTCKDGEATDCTEHDCATATKRPSCWERDGMTICE